MRDLVEISLKFLLHLYMEEEHPVRHTCLAQYCLWDLLCFSGRQQGLHIYQKSLMVP